MKYIGNKTRLLNFIYDSMKKSKIPMEGDFCDMFGGTGAVGSFFKKHGFRIISNDLLTYSYIQQYVYVKMNKMPSFNKLKQKGIFDVFDYLNKIIPYEGYAFNNYAPSGKFNRQYFSDDNAKKIDAIRDQIEKWKNDNLISVEEFYTLVYSLLNAADFIANISGTYGAYLKIWRPMALKDMKLLLPEFYDNGRNNEIFKTDANRLISNISCDVLYLDPPYNERQYASYFHVLESLAVWDKQELKGKTGQRDYSKQKSSYCLKKEAAKSFENLITTAKAKYIVLSYNNEGIISREEILRILENKGEMVEYQTKYRRFRTEKDNEHRKYKECDDKVIEHLYIVKVAKNEQL